MLLFRIPSRRRCSTEAPSKHAQRKGNKLARTGRESSPGPFAGNPCRRTTRQNPHGPRSRQKSKKNRVCAGLRSRNALQHQARARICGKNHAKRSRTEVDTSLCASLRSRNAFQHQAKARICGKYHAKRLRTEVANSLCASLRSRNALRHQARARICGKYHAKRSRPERAPQSGTKAFSLTVRTP